MTVQEYNVRIWPFYLRLEEEFLNSLNYVEFSKDNFKTYSIEYEKQILSIGSEVDILCKLLCKEVAPDSSPNQIQEYREILYDYYENIGIEQVTCLIDGRTYSPIKSWTKKNSPIWWKAYNKVKHARMEKQNYKRGNLGNVFYALASLYVFNRYYCKAISMERGLKEPTLKSQLFSMVGWEVRSPVGNGFMASLRPNGNIGLRL